MVTKCKAVVEIFKLFAKGIVVYFGVLLTVVHSLSKKEQSARGSLYNGATPYKYSSFGVRAIEKRGQRKRGEGEKWKNITTGLMR